MFFPEIFFFLHFSQTEPEKPVKQSQVRFEELQIPPF